VESPFQLIRLGIEVGLNRLPSGRNQLHPSQSRLTSSMPHCGGKEFILWRAAADSTQQTISCDGCGAVLSSTNPLDPDDRPMPRP
jgi:hypothetical protein